MQPSITVSVTRGLQGMEPPSHLPFDDAQPLHPDSEYGLSQETGEAANRMACRRHGIQAVALRLPSGALAEPQSSGSVSLPAPRTETVRLLSGSRYRLGSARASSVTAAAMLAQDGRPPDEQRVRILRSYVHLRDAARAFRRGVKTDGLAAEPFHLCAADTGAALPTQDLTEHFHPQVETREPMAGHASAVSTARARDRLGFVPPVFMAASRGNACRTVIAQEQRT